MRYQLTKKPDIEGRLNEMVCVSNMVSGKL